MLRYVVTALGGVKLLAPWLRLYDQLPYKTGIKLLFQKTKKLMHAPRPFRRVLALPHAHDLRGDAKLRLGRSSKEE